MDACKALIRSTTTSNIIIAICPCHHEYPNIIVIFSHSSNEDFLPCLKKNPFTASTQGSRNLIKFQPVALWYISASSSGSLLDSCSEERRHFDSIVALIPVAVADAVAAAVVAIVVAVLLAATLAAAAETSLFI